MLGNAAISVRPGTGFARFGDVAERAAEVGRWKASSEDRSFQTIGRCADGIHFLMLFVTGLFLASFAKLVRTNFGFDRKQPGNRSRGSPRAEAGWSKGQCSVGPPLGPAERDPRL